MDTIKSQFVGIPMGLVVAAVVNAILFMGLPILTQIQRSYQEREYQDSIMLARYQPPKPPDILKERKIKDEKPKSVKNKQESKKLTSSKPKIAIPKFNLAVGGEGLSGSVAIASPKQPTLTTSLFQTAFTLAEVDQPPRILRSIEPLYPFAAKRKNIEGSVTLRFVVTKEGEVQEPHVVESEPPDVFDSSALKAIARFKFKPAIKDGRAVDCIVIAPLKFNLIK